MSIKTYYQVHQADATKSFGISSMTQIYQKRKGKPDEPHRHDYYTVLCIKKGAGIHFVDFEQFKLGEYQVFFIQPGQVHQLMEEEATEGFAIVFSETFLSLNHIEKDFLDDLMLFEIGNRKGPLRVDSDTFQLLVSYCNQLLQYYEQKEKYSYEAMGALLKLFLIACHQVCDLKNLDTQTAEAGISLLKNFKELLHAKYQHWHQTQPYAQALNISPDHLNRVVKSLSGKTTKDWIQHKLIIEAKRLLHFSNLTTKEITYELGFSEPSNFSAFFKKHTGISPTQFVYNQ